MRRHEKYFFIMLLLATLILLYLISRAHLWCCSKPTLQETEGKETISFFTLARTLITQQLEALPAVTLKTPNGVLTKVLTAAVVEFTFIDICNGNNIKK